MLAACGGGGFSEGDATATSVDELTSDSSKPMTVMIWSSSDAEDNAVKDAVAAWSKKSGHKAVVSGFRVRLPGGRVLSFP